MHDVCMFVKCMYVYGYAEYLENIIHIRTCYLLVGTDGVDSGLSLCVWYLHKPVHILHV